MSDLIDVDDVDDEIVAAVKSNCVVVGRVDGDADSTSHGRILKDARIPGFPGSDGRVSAGGQPSLSVGLGLQHGSCQGRAVAIIASGEAILSNGRDDGDDFYDNGDDDEDDEDDDFFPDEDDEDFDDDDDDDFDDDDFDDL